MKAIPSKIKAEPFETWARGSTSFSNSCISLAVTVLQGVLSVDLKDMGTGLRAYDNSSSRSMPLLLPMISSRLNMSLLAFIDAVSDMSLAIAFS